MSRTSALKRWPGWVLLVFVVVGCMAYGIAKNSGPLTPDQRVESITKRLACPVCGGETVFESANSTSVAIRAEVKAQVDAGANSDDQIIAYIVQNFSAKTQLLPTATGFESLVWVLPLTAFVCATVGLGFAFRRWKTNADSVPDDADRALVEAALSDDAQRSDDAPGPDAQGPDAQGPDAQGPDARGPGSPEVEAPDEPEEPQGGS
jgi:cytochrome c-type biogenesis protein CcmH